MHDSGNNPEKTATKLAKRADQATLNTRRLSVRDLRGLTRLGVDGVIAMTGMIESVHGNVVDSLSPFRRGDNASSSRQDAKTTGLTRLVYRSITGITGITGRALDGGLALMESEPKPLQPAQRERESVLAILNGVLGDHLHDSDNPLAIRSSVRWHGRTLNIDDAQQLRSDLSSTLQDSEKVISNKIILYVHGLCMHDQHWLAAKTAKKPQNHAAPAEQLAASLGYTPLYLHYNSGRHISHNGRALAERLDTLLNHWPVPVTSLTIVGHSMGGLIARSACRYAELEQQDWLQHLQHLVFIGTPHHGAPLERIGHQIDRLLHASRFSRPFARIGQMRSAGITDLRYGNVMDEDWLPHHRFEESRDTRLPVPLPEAVKCYAVAGSLARSKSGEKLPGDGLVPVTSALGQHPDAQLQLSLPPSQQRVVPGSGHVQLLHHPCVWQQLEEWLAD